MNDPVDETSVIVQPEGWTVRPITPEEKFYLDLADDAVKQSIPRLNDAINRLITLGSAMAGGSLVFLKDDVCAPWCRFLAAFGFFLALAYAVYASIPSPAQVTCDAPSIKKVFEDVADEKNRRVTISTCLLVAGLAFAILGAFIRLF